MFKSSVTASARLLRADFYRPQMKFAKVMFLHVPVILSTEGGGWYPSMPCSRSRRGLQTHTQGGSWGVWPGGGVSRSTPRGDVYPSMHWGRPSPPTTAAAAVRILLECILVVHQTAPCRRHPVFTGSEVLTSGCRRQGDHTDNSSHCSVRSCHSYSQVYCVIKIKGSDDLRFNEAVLYIVW